MSGVAHSVFGTGEYEPEQRQIQSDQFVGEKVDAGYDAARANLNDRQGTIDNRQGPTAQAAQTDLSQLYKAQLQNAQTASAAGVNLSPAERVGQVNIGNVSQAQGAQLGAAAQATAAQLNSQDAQFRNNQVALSNQLTNQMNGQGPSLAGNQYQEAQERNLAGQMGAAAALGGRNAGLQQRQLAMSAAQQGQATARDVANIRTQEQLAATQQLAGVSAQGRDQDINLASQNAQLQQQAALANQGATNQFGLTQAQMAQQNSQFNAGALNARQSEQAQLNQQANLANQAAGNSFALQQGQMSQQNNQFNAGAQNQAFLQNAQLQAANEANYGSQYNQTLGQNTQNQQGVNLANQQATLQQQQQNDAMSQFYQQQILGQNTEQANRAMALEQMKTEQDNARIQSEQAAYEASRGALGSTVGSFAGAGAGGVAGAAASSDSRGKSGIKSGDEKIKDFFSNYKKNNNANSTSLLSSSPAEKKNKIDPITPAPVVPAGGVNTVFSPPSVTPAAPVVAGQGSTVVVQAPAPVTPTTTTPVAPAPAVPAPSTPSSSSSESERQKKDDERWKAILKGYQNQQPAAASGFGGSLIGGIGTGMSLVDKVREGRGNSSSQKIAAQTHQARVREIQNNNANNVMMRPNAALTTGMTQQEINAATANMPVVQNNQTPGIPVSTAGMRVAPPIASSDIKSKTDITSSSPAGAKTGISSGDMKIGNFFSSLRGNNMATDDTPIMYDKFNGAGSMDVRGSMQNHSNTATAYQTNPANYSDHPGSNYRGPAGVAAGGPVASNNPANYAGPKIGSDVSAGSISGAGEMFGQGLAGLAMSDKNTKKDIKTAIDNQVGDFMDNLHAYEYQYKDPNKPGAGEGRFVSPMAQELEQTEIGKSAVIETPEGKIVDYGKLSGAMLAGIAYLNERMNNVEGKPNKPVMDIPEEDLLKTNK